MGTKQRQSYLRRLPAAYYRAEAYVHWSLTIENRATDWLVPALYGKFREVLTHTAFRFGLCSPMYCCMPDHLHMLWLDVLPQCDQRKAMQYFRRQLNSALSALGTRFQLQAYDHVLRDAELERDAFEEVANYIARNPERQGIIPPDCFAEYTYTGCLVPGYPELRPFEAGYWERFWRIYSHLRKNGLHVGVGADASEQGGWSAQEFSRVGIGALNPCGFSYGRQSIWIRKNSAASR